MNKKLKMKNGTKIGIGIMLAFMLICVVPTNTIATLSGNETLTFSSLSNVVAEATLYYSGSGVQVLTQQANICEEQLIS